MKANELMIGDLVQVNRDGLCIKSGTIVKVLGLDSESKLEKKGLIGCAGCQPLDKEQFSGGIWCEYLSPIPLTPEILEKNGFIEGSTNGLHSIYYLRVPAGIEKNLYTVQVTLYKEPICGVSTLFNCWGPHSGGTDDIFLCNVHYVHEMQHALRLCGVEKEIVL